MKTKLLIAALLMMSIACKKKAEPEQNFNITMHVSGQGNYQYVIGYSHNSGHCNGPQLTFTGVAHPGDVVSISATGDSIATAPYRNAMAVQMQSSPTIAGMSGNAVSGTSPSLLHQISK